MAQNLMIDGTVFHGVDSISMTNENGEKVTYIEKTNAGTGVYVAEIGERQFYTVEDALAAAAPGVTVTMIADSTEAANLIIPAGVILNLQGHALTANNIVGIEGSSLGGSPWSNNAGGRVIIGQKNLSLPRKPYYDGKYDVILIWDTVDKCYKFTRMIVNSSVASNRGLTITDERIRFQFNYQSSGFIHTMMQDVNGAEDNGLKFLVRMEWETDAGTANQDFIFSNAQVATVAVRSPVTDFAMAVNGYEALNINMDTLEVYGVVETDYGAVVIGDKWTAENAN